MDVYNKAVEVLSRAVCLMNVWSKVVSKIFRRLGVERCQKKNGCGFWKKENVVGFYIRNEAAGESN